MRLPASPCEAGAVVHPSIVFDREHLARLRRWTRRAYPREACGLLLGDRGREAVRRVRLVLPARNLATRPDRFEVHPLDHLTAHRRAADLGLALCGVWHSHPDHPARASARDLAGAVEGWSYTILAAPGRGPLRLASFRALDGVLLRERVTLARLLSASPCPEPTP